MTVQTVAIDMAHTDGLRTTVLDLEKQYGITVEVVNAHGPAGGWPEVVLRGERSAVERCLRVHWATGDDESDDEFVSEVLPA